MTSIADLLGAPGELAFEGVTYQVRPPTQIEQGMFTQWLLRNERDNALRTYELDPTGGEVLLRIHSRNAATRHYDWGTDAYMEALRQPAGQAKMLELVLRGANPGKTVTEEMMLRFVEQKIAEVAAVLLAQEADDPKAQEAILASVGLPPNFLGTSEKPSSESSTPPSTDPSTKSSE